MDISVEEIVTGAAAILLASLVQPLLPETITEIEPLTLLNNPYLRILLVAVIAFTVFSWVVRTVRNKISSENGGSSAAFVATAKSRPEREVSTWTIEHFGVKWRVLYGRRRIGGDLYAYTESAVCPECDTDLMTDTKSRRIRSDKQIWKCPGCGFTQGRPKQFLYEEDDAVERIVEREVRERGR